MSYDRKIYTRIPCLLAEEAGKLMQEVPNLTTVLYKAKDNNVAAGVIKDEFYWVGEDGSHNILVAPMPATINPTTVNATNVNSTNITTNDIVVDNSISADNLISSTVTTDTFTVVGPMPTGVTYIPALQTLAVTTVHTTVGGTDTETITLNIPSGALLIGAQVMNLTAITGDDGGGPPVPITDYAISYTGGNSEDIDTAMSLGLEDEINVFFDTNVGSAITTNTTDVLIDAGAGNTFDADLEIAVTVYYQVLSMTFPA
jgi:hypothetical protein